MTVACSRCGCIIHRTGTSGNTIRCWWFVFLFLPKKKENLICLLFSLPMWRLCSDKLVNVTKMNYGQRWLYNFQPSLLLGLLFLPCRGCPPHIPNSYDIFNPPAFCQLWLFLSPFKSIRVASAPRVFVCVCVFVREKCRMLRVCVEVSAPPPNVTHNEPWHVTYTTLEKLMWPENQQCCLKFNALLFVIGIGGGSKEYL